MMTREITITCSYIQGIIELLGYNPFISFYPEHGIVILHTRCQNIDNLQDYFKIMEINLFEHESLAKKTILEVGICLDQSVEIYCNKEDT